MLTAIHLRHVLAATFLWLASAVRADDWPQWRGLNRDGVWAETGLAETFPADGLKIRWRAPVGVGFSSPVVAQGRVYVTDSHLEKPKARERVLCFDAATGAIVWTFSHDVNFPDWAFTPGQEKGPNSTPIVRDGKLYVLGSLGHLFCFEAEKGGVLWQRDLAQEYKFEETQTTASSPLIDGDLLIILLGMWGDTPDECVLALDKNTGKEKWRAIKEIAAHSSPVIITAGGVRQLIVWNPKAVTSLDPATGAVRWREPYVTSLDVVVSTPVFAKNRLLAGGQMWQLDADKPAATVLWPLDAKPVKRVLSATSTALLLGDLVFSAKTSGELVCLDAATGAQVWIDNTVTDLKSGPSIAITANGDSALLFNERGELIRARLDATGYHELSRAKLIEPTYRFGGRGVAWAPPAFANAHVFARSDKELVCASLAKTP